MRFHGEIRLRSVHGRNVMPTIPRPRSRRDIVAGVVAVAGVDIMATRVREIELIGASVQRHFNVEVRMDSEPVKS